MYPPIYVFVVMASHWRSEWCPANFLIYCGGGCHTGIPDSGTLQSKNMTPSSFLRCSGFIICKSARCGENFSKIFFLFRRSCMILSSGLLYAFFRSPDTALYKDGCLGTKEFCTIGNLIHFVILRCPCICWASNTSSKVHISMRNATKTGFSPLFSLSRVIICKFARCRADFSKNF